MRSAARSPRRSAQARLIELTLNPALTGFTLPKLLWVREKEPSLWERVRSVLLPKDYVRYRLTGAMATDVADASGTLLLDVSKRAWSETMLQELDLDPSAAARSLRVTRDHEQRVARRRRRHWLEARHARGRRRRRSGGRCGRHGHRASGRGQRHHRHLGRRLRRHRSAGPRAAAAASTRSVTPSRDAGTSWASRSRRANRCAGSAIDLAPARTTAAIHTIG